MNTTAESLDLARPRHATPATLGLATMGPRCAVVSRNLGAPFMPWQHQVATTGLQLHPSIPGAYRYRLVIVTVPRQAGKTTLMRALAIDRAIANPRAGIWTTAQTGQQARRRWADLKDTATSRTSPIRGHVVPYLSAGSEQLKFPNASFVSPFAPVPKALHGETPELVMIDETWAFDQDQGQALMDAIRPAQITLPQRQLWIFSTRGTQTSRFLNDLLAQGLASLDDPNTETAYFDWSADPALADADPAGTETLAFHPAVGHTQRLADLQAELPADPSPLQLATFRRGYLNLTTAGDSGTVADLAAWAALAEHQQPAPPARGLVYGYSVAEGRAGASIWAAERTEDGIRLRFVETNPGAAWLPARLAQLQAEGATLVCDDDPATRTVTTSRAMLGLNVTRAGARDYATACTALLGRIKDGTVRHDGAPELAEALGVAELRQGRFDDRYSRGPIDALKAAALAAYYAELAPGNQLF